MTLPESLLRCLPCRPASTLSPPRTPTCPVVPRAAWLFCRSEVSTDWGSRRSEDTWLPSPAPASPASGRAPSPTPPTGRGRRWAPGPHPEPAAASACAAGGCRALWETTGEGSTWGSAKRVPGELGRWHQRRSEGQPERGASPWGGCICH